MKTPSARILLNKYKFQINISVMNKKQSRENEMKRDHLIIVPIVICFSTN